MSVQLSISILNKHREIRNLRNNFDDFSQENNIPNNIRRDVQLTLDELITNIVDYGYGDDKDHVIEVGFSLNKTNLTIIIIDNAKTYNILDRDDPDTTQSIDKKPDGGLGVYLVKRLMTEVKYEHKDGKNRLTLIKELT